MAQDTDSPVIKWMYEVVNAADLSSAQLETQMNQLGKEGWEAFLAFGKNVILRRPIPRG